MGDVVDGHVHEIAGCQRAAKALFETADAKDLLAAERVPRLEPTSRALRLGIKKLGGRLHELGGTDLMRSAAERVADMRRGFSG
jgi:hypothetical protein